RDGLKVYNGNFDDYMESKKQAAVKELPLVQPNKESDNKSNYRSRQQRSEDTKKRTRVQQLERLIAETEQEISSLHEKISLPENASDFELLKDLCDQLEHQKTLHEQFFEEWILLQE
ncbi:MAG: multidrug transporter ATP-binding protein, partial [Oscillospiraceae bacterium]|nr:multidrug transporter ATP-binding protein [Oscillospiraceae bacterium]